MNVKNKAKNDIRKLLLTGKAGGKTITFTAKNLKVGKTMTLSKNFELTSKTERDTPEFECQKLQVYAGSMVSTYRYASDKLSSDYATPDKKSTPNLNVACLKKEKIWSPKNFVKVLTVKTWKPLF